MKDLNLILTSLGFVLLSACSDKCDLACNNGGIVTIDCECACPEGFAGDNCETEVCAITCENGGIEQSDCTCDCPAGFSGDNCETCEPITNLVNRGVIYDARDGGPNFEDDLEVVLPENYVLTGFGFRKSSTLVVQGREMYEDGTLGPEVEFRDGPNPTGTVDVSYKVPDGHVISGFGFGESQDIYRLVVNYNEILVDDNCDVSFSTEKLYDNNANRALEVWVKISDSSYDQKMTCFGSVGIIYSGTLKRAVEGQARELLNNSPSNQKQKKPIAMSLGFFG